MNRRRILHNLRTAAYLSVFLLVAAVIVALIWANVTGLPESWRVRIENEISKHGTHVRIGSLSYNPLRGLVAKRIHVFSDAERLHEISQLEGLTLDFDNSRLTKGEFKLNKLELNNATLALPVYEQSGDTPELLEITNANGSLLIHDDGQIELRNASGTIEGIELRINARLSTAREASTGPKTAAPQDKRMQSIAHILKELKRWNFDKQQPPQLEIFVEGNIRKPESVTARLSFNARDVEKNQHRLDTIAGEAELDGNLLTITSLRASMGSQQLDAHIDYDLNSQSGRFDVDSTLAIPPLLTSWFELPPLRDLTVSGDQHIQAEGEFEWPSPKQRRLHITGRASGDAITAHGIQFDRVETAFSWKDGDLYLKDVHLLRPDGEARGKALIQWPLVRLDLDSTMLPGTYLPLFGNQTTASVITAFESNEHSRVHLHLEGGYDITDHQSWAYTGSGTFENLSYRSIPVAKASGDFSLSYNQQQYSNGKVTFDYSNYPLAKQHGGAKSGTTTFEQVNYRRKSHSITIKQLEGKAWPAPIVRMFSTKIADSLEQYRFHQPPAINASGTIILGDEGTDLDVAFTSDADADYKLLGSDVRLSAPSGSVLIKSDEVTIKDLKAGVFRGNTTVNLAFLRDGLARHDIQWTNLDLNEISRCYDLEMKCGGEITGRTDFTIIRNKIATMNGSGHFTLNKSELFSVPIFGPLSPLISGVLGDRRAGFERAKDAFCSITIKDGVMFTDDFQTSTTSLVFTGDGQVDLNQKTIDMTMRLNAKGFLGIITLPFRPFYGMFQFRGTGPLNKVVWENVMFTQPNDKQKNLLDKAPKAKVVEPDNP